MPADAQVFPPPLVTPGRLTWVTSSSCARPLGVRCSRVRSGTSATSLNTPELSVVQPQQQFQKVTATHTAEERNLVNVTAEAGRGGLLGGAADT